jgi:YcaO-like protein with predicted kinase domain
MSPATIPTGAGGASPSAPPGPVSKRFQDGTHRLVSPEETVARVRGMALLMGVTRVADVTGLDTLGVPVVMVCRPNARSLSVSQGKGLTLAAAKASGLMESVEHYHAEHISLPLKFGTFNELRMSHTLADVAVLPRLTIGAFHESLRLLWVAGQDLVGGAPTWVPFEVVHTDYSLPLPAGSGSFMMSSSGLASGNHPLEAASHAICELVERDATTLFRLSSEAEQRRARVDLSTVDDPGCLDILARFERADVDAFVWETTTDIGIPAFSCTIVDRDPNPARPIGPMGGMGCHPCRGIALLRALTEAAQSRLTMITGSRDDISHSPTGTAGELAAARALGERLRVEAPTRSFRDAPCGAGESFDADVAWALGRLCAAGLRQVIAVDLTKAEFGIPVVRVVIPGLEPLNDIPGYVPGKRAQRRMMERTS